MYECFCLDYTVKRLDEGKDLMISEERTKEEGGRGEDIALWEKILEVLDDCLVPFEAWNLLKESR